jgi:hypothetical protein
MAAMLIRLREELGGKRLLCKGGSGGLRAQGDSISIAIAIAISIVVGGWHWQLVASVAQQQEASPQSAIYANES